MLAELKKLLKEIRPVKGKYLVSCFYTDGGWRADFYANREHKIYTYTKVKEKMQITKDDIFQKEKKPLERLDIRDVRIPPETAVETAAVEKDKAIIILQVIDGATVWNVTILTPQFSVVNVKVDAQSGEVLSRNESSLLSFKKPL